jgi:hypothetical protein
MLLNNTFTDIIKRDEYIICDYDGVIQQLDVLWVKKAVEHKELFKDYFDPNKLANITDVLDRDTYYINTWLLKDRNKPLPPDLLEEFINLYINDVTFYRYCPFLIMAKALRELLSLKFVKKVVFLSHLPEGKETADIRKDIQVQKFFGANNNKVSINVIPSSMNKSEFINTYHPNYTAFIDDRSDIIRDVIDNTKSDMKTFLMPIYNYNIELRNDKEYLTKCYDKGIQIVGYNNTVI